MEMDEITGAVIDVAVQAHRMFGPRLLESLYESVLACELRRRGLGVERQRLIKISYNGIDAEDAFRADLIVAERVVVEVKSADRLARVHAKQLLTYLRLTNLQVGLLLNFGAETMKEGIERVVNNYTPSRFARLRVDKPREETLHSVRSVPDTDLSGAPMSPRIQNHE